MRSLTARLTLGLLACIVAGGAAFYLFRIETEVLARRERMSAFDRTARTVSAALATARAAQLSYVVEGQDAGHWQPTVESALSLAPVELDTLRTLSATADVQALILEARSRVEAFESYDRRTLDYLSAGDRLMAGDVVLAEGAPAAAAAAELVDSAWRSELETFDAVLRELRLNQLYVAVGAAGGLLSIVILLAAIPPGAREAMREREAAVTAVSSGLDLHLRADTSPASNVQLTVPPAPERPVPLPAPPPSATAEPPAAARVNQTPAIASRFEAPTTSLLKTAAEICVSLGAVSEGADLRELLGRAGALMDASGVIVWVGDADGSDLKATTAHGYAPHVLTRMPAVPRDADNAAAAAYRTATLQVVASHPGQAGAVVAPIVTPAGCVGALTAEVAAGREISEETQALALLFAAQLSALLAPDASPDSRAASA
jgi:hypothetical protein